MQIKSKKFPLKVPEIVDFVAFVEVFNTHILTQILTHSTSV